MKKIIYTLTALAFLATVQVNAQEIKESKQPEQKSKTKSEKVEIKESDHIPKNIFRTNLTGIFFRNYSFEYERVLNRRFSVGLGYRFMPSGSLPLAKTFSGLVDGGENNSDLQTIVESFKISSNGFTPSVRFYPTAKGYGRGFYLSAFYRNVNYKIAGLHCDYDNNTKSVDLEGKLKTNTFGFTIGKQWTIGRYFVIDYTILGFMYGTANGTLTGNYTQPLDADDQKTLEDALNGIEIPLVKANANVSANKAVLNLDGPWAGFRTGLSIGIRF